METGKFWGLVLAQHSADAENCVWSLDISLFEQVYKRTNTPFSGSEATKAVKEAVYLAYCNSYDASVTAGVPFPF